LPFWNLLLFGVKFGHKKEGEYDDYGTVIALFIYLTSSLCLAGLWKSPEFFI